MGGRLNFQGMYIKASALIINSLLVTLYGCIYYNFSDNKLHVAEFLASEPPAQHVYVLEIQSPKPSVSISFFLLGAAACLGLIFLVFFLFWKFVKPETLWKMIQFNRTSRGNV